MEFAFLIFLFVGIVVFVVGGRSQKKEDAGRSGKSPLATKSKSSIVPFDRKTATPVVQDGFLEGKARIVDGDTLVIQRTQIRLFGIDAPEIDHPYGQKAKWALVSLCKGQTVCADIVEQDSHGRTVAKCSLPDGRDLSAEMVKLGMAIDWPKFSGGKYRALETPDARRKLWLADARQKGRMHVWEQYEAKKAAKRSNKLGS